MSHDHEPAPQPTIDWREHGVKVIKGDQLDTNTPQTPGMNRAAAINAARAGAQKLWAGTVTIQSQRKGRRDDVVTCALQGILEGGPQPLQRLGCAQGKMQTVIVDARRLARLQRANRRFAPVPNGRLHLPPGHQREEISAIGRDAFVTRCPE